MRLKLHSENGLFQHLNPDYKGLKAHDLTAKNLQWNYILRIILKISCSIFFLDENPESFRRAARNPPKRKESESGQSGSAGSDSGSDSSGSGDSDSDSDSDSSASETSRGVKKPVALQIRNLSARSNGELRTVTYDFLPRVENVLGHGAICPRCYIPKSNIKILCVLK
jgi:hypothetical protein